MEQVTKIQKAINVIEKRPGIRTAELAEAIGVPAAKVAPLIFAATSSRFIVSCKVDRPGLAPTNEYRLSAGVVASDWDKYRSIHAAEQVRAKRAEAYRRDTDSAAVKRGVADVCGRPAVAEAVADDLENKIEGMSEQIACLQIELEVAQQTIHKMELEAAQAAGVVDVAGKATGYLVRAHKRAPRVFAKRDSAVKAARAMARTRGRADVLALVPVGTARRKIAASVDWSGS